jgi:hypothetical protein
VALTVGGPEASCSEEMARPVSTTTLPTWQWWHQLGRWVRPVQDDTSLVGKPPGGGGAAVGQPRGGLHQIELVSFGVEHGDPVLAVFLDGA